MPLPLREDHKEFDCATPGWLVAGSDARFDWSVYCDTPRSLPALAKYLPKDVNDRSGVHPLPDGWPLRT